MSNRIFHNVTRSEIASVLLPRGFSLISLPGVVELVYAKRMDQRLGEVSLCLSLRVFTGINPNGQSRDVGKDAIRVAMFWKNLNQADPQNATSPQIVLVSGEKRVNRIKTWRKNLEERLDNWDDIPTTACPECGSPVVLKHGKYGDFYGCAAWPSCNYKKKNK